MVLLQEFGQNLVLPEQLGLQFRDPPVQKGGAMDQEDLGIVFIFRRRLINVLGWQLVFDEVGLEVEGRLKRVTRIEFEIVVGQISRNSMQLAHIPVRPTGSGHAHMFSVNCFHFRPKRVLNVTYLDLV